MAAAVRTGVRSPVLAWVGLGVIPHLADPLGFMDLGGAVSGSVFLLSMCITAAVLSGGSAKLALDLTRGVECSKLVSPWSCEGSASELTSVTKPGVEGGGVLCCR